MSGLGTGEFATSLARLVDLRVVRSAVAAAEMAARDGRTRIGGRSNVGQYACCSHDRLLSAGAQSRCRDAME